MRDVQYSPQLGRVASLVTSGAVHLWDPHMRLARTVRARCPPRPAGAWSPLHGAAHRVCACTALVRPALVEQRRRTAHGRLLPVSLLQPCGRCG